MQLGIQSAHLGRWVPQRIALQINILQSDQVSEAGRDHVQLIEGKVQLH